MDSSTIQLVQNSWQKVVAIGPQAAALFYQNLFEADPALKPLFKGDLQAQGKKLIEMISVAVNKLTELNVLVPVLQNLGKRHGGYGVQDSHYDTVGAALLKTLGQGLGNEFTQDVKIAWTNVYGVMADVMKEAAK
ncbi:hemin receptor [Cellvibrio sp. KY-GH-1]|uniref:globin family protein n=1 Tax=Cellvibrio sp. KY-GH-1 TaxID=2303332 RepID=UPI0012478C1B|nr:globin family protein [Cellvibrio sp. KY-GH-1]QEY16976.1 hemin receptor [Cellvibrio sp. KY-GH-1]